MIKSKIPSVLSRIRQYSDQHALFFPLVLLAFALVTYGVFLFKLGFYWDDWPPILLAHTHSVSGIWEYWSYDRPFQSWTYYLLFPLCGDSPALWQLSAILARWAAALTLYYTFLLVSPRQKNLLQWAAVLFVVFPGFADQYASVSYGSHFMVYTLFGLSMLFMALAMRKPRQFWVYFPLSLLFTAGHLFSMEYFVGLELLRPVLLYWMLKDEQPNRSKVPGRVILYWLPYLAVLGGYIYWRMVIYPNTGVGYGGSNYPHLLVNFIHAPLDTTVTFFQTLYTDLRFLMLDIWTNRAIPVTIEIKSATLWLSLILGLLSAYLLHFFFAQKEEGEELHLKKEEIGRNFVLFLVIFFFGMFPIWSTLRQITKGKWSDRFDLPVIFGVLILLLTLLYLLIQKQKLRNGFLVVITGLSMAYQMQIANDFRKDFTVQKDFYSQLSWRIPALEPGTTLYSPGIPSGKEADYSYSMGINLLLTRGPIDTTFDYWFSGPRYYAPEDLLANPSLEIKDGLRTYEFSGTASKVVSIYKGDGCLLVVDPYYTLLPDVNSQFWLYGQLTNQDLISESGPEKNSLSKVVNTAPQNTWCYYFEKADLAFSKGKMEDVVSYYEQAMDHHLVPLEAVEYLPFVRAYAQLGNVDEAVALTDQAFTKSGSARNSICQFWHDFLAANPSVSPASVESVYNSKNCSILETK